MEEKYFVTDFSGGLNDTVASVYLKDGCLSECQNADLSFEGGIGKRKGTDRYYPKKLYGKANADATSTTQLNEVRFIFAKEVMIYGKKRIFFVARNSNSKKRASNYYFGYMFADKDYDIELDISEYTPLEIKEGDVIHYYGNYYKALGDYLIIGRKKKNIPSGKWAYDVTNSILEGNFCWDVYECMKGESNVVNIIESSLNFSNTAHWQRLTYTKDSARKDGRGYTIVGSFYGVSGMDFPDISLAQTEKGIYFSFNGRYYRIGGYDYCSDDGYQPVFKNVIVYVNDEGHQEAVEYGKYYRKNSSGTSVSNLIPIAYSTESAWGEIDIENTITRVPAGLGDFDYTYRDDYVDRIDKGEVVIGPTYKKISSNGKVTYKKVAGSLSRYMARKDYIREDADGDNLIFDLDTINYYKTGNWINISSRKKIRQDANDTDEDVGIGEIERCSLMTYHPYSKRIFAANHPIDKKAVYYSDSNNFNVFRRDATLYPSGGIGDVKAMIVIEKYLCVGYENGWYVFKGGIGEDEPYEWQPLPIPYGVVNNKCVVATPNSFAFFTGTKIVQVDNSIFADISSNSSSHQAIKIISDDMLEKTISKMKNKDNCSMAFADGKVYLAYSDNAKIEYCNKMIEYDFSSSKGFNIYTGLVIYHLFTKNNTLFIGSKDYIISTGILNEENGRGLSDYNPILNRRVPIEFKVRSKMFDFGHFNKYKYLKRIMPVYLQNIDMEGDSVLSISVVGEDSSKVSQSLDLKDSLIWGRAWGNIWGFSEVMYKYMEMDLTSINFELELEHKTFDDMLVLLSLGFVYDVLKTEVGHSKGNEGKLLE